MNILVNDSIREKKEKTYLALSNLRKQKRPHSEKRRMKKMRRKKRMRKRKRRMRRKRRRMRRTGRRPIHSHLPKCRGQRSRSRKVTWRKSVYTLIIIFFSLWIADPDKFNICSHPSRHRREFQFAMSVQFLSRETFFSHKNFHVKLQNYRT